MISLKASRIRVMVEIEKVVANKPLDKAFGKILSARRQGFFGKARREVQLEAHEEARRAAHQEAIYRKADSGTYSVYSEFNSRPVYKVNFNVETT